MGRTWQEVATTWCSRCIYFLLLLCHKEEVKCSSSCLSWSFHFTCNEVIAGGQLLTPAESFSPLVVSLFNTLHIAPSLSSGCHWASEFTPTSSLIFKLELFRRANNGCGWFLRIWHVSQNAPALCSWTFYFILSPLPGAVHRQLSAGDQGLISMSHGLYGGGRGGLLGSQTRK